MITLILTVVLKTMITMVSHSKLFSADYKLVFYFASILTCFCSFAFFPPPSTIQLHNSDKPWYLRKAFKHDWSVVCCQKKKTIKKNNNKIREIIRASSTPIYSKWLTSEHSIIFCFHRSSYSSLQKSLCKFPRA